MDFLRFEIAKKLKEKGFPQVKKNTIAMYSEDGDWYSLAKNLDEFEYSFEDFDECDEPETISEIVPHPLKFNVKTQPCVLTNQGIVTEVIKFD